MKYLKNPLIFALLILLTASALPNRAYAEFTIATVDMAQLLNENSESKEARDKLSEQSKKAKAKVEQKRQALQSKEAELKKKNVSLDSKEAEQFRQDAKEFQRFVKDAEDELKREFMRTNTKVTKKALDAIQGYARSHKIDLVLDKGSVGRSAVLFGTPQVDITDAIIKKMRG